MKHFRDVLQQEWREKVVAVANVVNAQMVSEAKASNEHPGIVAVMTPMAVCRETVADARSHFQ